MEDIITAFGIINLEDDCSINSNGYDLVNQTSKINQDVILLAHGRLNDIIDHIATQKGVISSKWFPITDEIKNGSSILESDEMAFVEVRYGKDDPFVDEFTHRAEIKAILGIKGVYDYVVLKQPNQKSLEEIMRNSPNIRNSITCKVETNLNLSQINSKPNLSGRNYIGFNKYEGASYTNNIEVNISYFEQCAKLAEEIIKSCRDLKSTVIYAPLRGAKPMVELTMEFLKQFLANNQLPRVVYPVTSSFVRYPESQETFSKSKKSPASGRYANILELRRLKKHMKDFKNLIYIDEVVSGGMMTGHCVEMVGNERPHKSDDRYKDMLDEGILRDLVSSADLNVYVFGLADALGSRFRDKNQEKLTRLQRQGLITFKAFPVKRLVTEDQRYLLGIHYLDYSQGPSSVPMIRGGSYFDEKQEFQKDFIEFNKC